MEHIKFEFEYQEEPRRLSEIAEAEKLLFRQVWYNHHWNLRHKIESGQVKLVSKEKQSAYPCRNDEIMATVWEGHWQPPSVPLMRSD